MEAKNRNRRCNSFANGCFANTRKIVLLLGDEGDGKAARGSQRFGSVPDEIKILLSGEGSERTLAPSVRPKPRTTASSGVV